jgi:hypothetical protein
MDFLKECRNRFVAELQSLDDRLLRIGRRQAELFREYRFFIAVMLIGFIVWSVVFNIALVDYLNTRLWNSRHAWLGPYPGPSEFNFLGFTFDYQFEGYSDYSFYYVHWGQNMLNGVMPYSSDFGYLDMNGIINENGAYMFPPLTAYLYGAGIWLENIIGPGNWGIGFLLASFGYLTALPVYGIAKELSKNPRVGEIAALTYLLNPLVLFHIDYIWLNPSAFYFFFFAGFYALVKDHRHIGTILIVAAALFKQTAWFLGIPLVVFLLLRKRSYPDLVSDSDGPMENAEGEKEERSKFAFLTDYFDFRAFAVSIVVAVSFAGAVMLPTLIAQPHFWNHWSLALGHFTFENYTDLPGYGTPVTIPVLAIAAGMPDLAELLDSIFVSGGPLILGVVVAFGAMALLDKVEGEEHIFMRRLLFITMLLMLWVSLTGPRGVFKYYFALFGPFFSIFASGRMIRGKQENALNDPVPVSLSMFLMPFAFTLLILIPDRNTYLLYALLVFVLYLFAPLFDRLYDLTKRPFRFLKRLASKRIQIEVGTTSLPYETRSSLKSKILEYIIIVYSILIGTILFLYGAYVGFPQVNTAISLILQYFMVAGVLILLGTQMISIGITGMSAAKKNRDNLNDVLHLLFASIAFVGLVFGLVSYMLSWNVELFFERQVLVISSTLIIIWILSLVAKLKKEILFLADIVLITGASLATWIWVLLSDIVMYTIGFACIAGLVLHFMFLLLGLFASSKDMDNSNPAEPEVIETVIQ